jgi:RNA polymerase sigma-70 factor (ECF subfamily)
MAIAAHFLDEHRHFLWGLCYRMTGNAADAEDIVQDTFARALEKPPANTRAPWRPWLAKVAMNLSRDRLRRRRRQQYFGPWLPSPVIADDHDQLAIDPAAASEHSPVARYELMESITLAFLVALEALTPAQRAVLLLRDVFDYSTLETAETLDMTENNVKVTLHRARQIMEAYDKRRVWHLSERADQLQVTLQRFLSKLAAGDVESLKQMLAADVVLVTDGGGEINALDEPVFGRDKVLRLIEKLYEAYRGVTSTLVQIVNGEPAILIYRSQVKPGHASFFTMHCELNEGLQMQRLHFVFAPSKLSALPKRQ